MLSVMTTIEYVTYRDNKKLIGMSFIILAFMFHMYAYVFDYSSDNVVTLTCMKIVHYICLAIGFTIYFHVLNKKLIIKLLIFCAPLSQGSLIINLILMQFMNPNPCQFSWWIILLNMASNMLIGLYLLTCITTSVNTFLIILLFNSHIVSGIGEDFIANNFCVSESASFERIALPLIYTNIIVFLFFMMFVQLHKLFDNTIPCKQNFVVLNATSSV